MANVAGKISLKIMTIAIAIPVGIVTKKAVERVWSAARPEGTPREPKEADVRWGDALAWGLLSAAGVVVADLISRRSAESAYRALTGSEPPAPVSKTEKARRKAAPAVQ